MNIKKIYHNLKERIKNYFSDKNYLTDEQRDYIISGISPYLRENYKIIYSPENVYFKADKNGTRIKNDLEYRLKSNSFYEKMKMIKLNHLKRLNEIYSSVVETYNQGLNQLKDVFIQNKSDGSLIVKFI